MSAHARMDGQKSSSCMHSIHALVYEIKTCAMHLKRRPSLDMQTTTSTLALVS